MSAATTTLRIARDPAAILGREEARAQAAEARLRTKVANAQSRMFGPARPMSLGDYPAAKRTRLKTGSRPQTGSGDAQLDSATATELRNLSRRAARANPVARALGKRITDMTVGRGMSLQVQSGDEEFDRACERYFETWAEDCEVRAHFTFAQVQRHFAQEPFFAGDLLCVLALTDVGPRLQLIDAERIADPVGTNGQISNGQMAKSDTAKRPFTVGGVELDGVGRVLAYHVAEYSQAGKSMGLTATRSVRVAAENAVFLADPMRPSQTRGEPGLCAVLGTLEHLDNMVESHVVAARMAACQGLIIKTAFPALTQAGMLGATVARTNAGTGASEEERHLEFKPGGVQHLKPGEEVEQVKPEYPATNFENFVRMLVRLVGSDVGLPLELLLLDYSQTNFHSARSAMTQAYRGIEARQQLIVNRALKPIYRFVIGDALSRGLLKMPKTGLWDKHRWAPPPKPVFDPKLEAEANHLAVMTNQTTLTDVLQGAGRDFDETIAVRSREVKAQRAAGCEPAPMPGAGSANGQMANGQMAKSEPRAEDDGADKTGAEGDGAENDTDA